MHSYTRERGWVDAGELQLGEHIRQADGEYGVVQAVEVEQRPQVMFNLTVATAHTFFVGDQQWLVHNSSRLCPGSPVHKAQRWADYQASGRPLSYEQWSAKYDAYMGRARRANAAADAYHQRVGWGTRELEVDGEGVPRRLDIGDLSR